MTMNFDKFIPYGTQYYRAPTPLKQDWESDLRNIRGYGFNTVKYFSQWRWNNPNEGVYKFDDIDRLMDLAAENDLKVILNIVFDVAPAWFFKKYPDSVMITCNGRRLDPQTIASRTVGGAPGPCFNNSDGKRVRMRFLAETVKRYTNHLALFIWDLWNEPEMTPGILRRPMQSDMLCYCNDCRMDFELWLKRKYGSIGRLNAKWNRNYNSFEEIELPRSGDSFNDMIDWRVYFSDVMTKELKQRVEVVKSHDRTTPVMVHTVPMPHFSAVSCCNNDYNLAAQCDIFGNSIGGNPFAAAINSSCADGRTVINSETHEAGGDTYIRSIPPTFEDVKGHVLVPLARGIKGFVYWQYRPERLGREGPAWGLAAMDGGRTDCLDYNSLICRKLQENAVLVGTVRPAPAEIAVVNSFKGQVFDWCASDSADMYVGSIIGTFMALYDANLNADIIGLETISEERLKKYKTVFLPFPYYMDEKTAVLLKDWTAAGGCLISEALFGAVTEENGFHSIEVPGYGFSEVFGVKEEIVRNGAKFIDHYDGSSATDGRYCPVPVKMDDQVFEGHYFMEELIPANAKVLGEFENGRPAVTVSNFGKGKAVMIGTLPGFAYYKTKAENISKMIAQLAMKGGITRNVTVDGGKVRADLLMNENGGAMLIVNGSNTEEANLTIQVFRDAGIHARIINLITNEDINIVKNPDGYEIRLALCARGHELFKFA